jgi:hypothetical protein
VPSEKRRSECGPNLKQLAAERVLNIQNGSGVSHILKEGPTLEKLVALEEVAVKVKLVGRRSCWVNDYVDFQC